jgi:hypothetical protein
MVPDSARENPSRQPRGIPRPSLIVGLSLLVNALLSLTILPYAFGARLTTAAPLLFILVYPVVLFLFLRMAILRRVRP